MTDTKDISQNLDLVSIFHYVLAALIYLKGMIAFFFMGIGSIAMAAVLSDRPHDMAIALFALFLIFFAAPMLVLCVVWTIATLVLLAGRRIAARTNLGYCQVIAALECLCVPLGTILGILTLIQLTKPQAKETFK
jgi:hypothetical protein